MKRKRTQEVLNQNRHYTKIPPIKGDKGEYIPIGDAIGRINRWEQDECRLRVVKEILFSLYWRIDEILFSIHAFIKGAKKARR